MAETASFSEVRPEVKSPRVSGLQPEQRASRHHVSLNVGESERYGSIIGGLALILAGISRRGLGGLILGTFGVAIIQRGLTGHCPLYESMGVSTTRMERPGVPDNLGFKVERSITINRRPEEVYRFWRDFRNFPQFMPHIERIDLLDEKRSHWVTWGPRGRKLEWDAEIINEHPNQLIAWESLPGATVQNAGSVRFEPAPGGRGTEVRVSLEYNPPGGVLGALGARVFGEAPEEQIEEDLLRLKQVLEAGEVATTQGQPVGKT